MIKNKKRAKLMKFIKDERKRRKLMQATVAKRLHQPQSYVSRLERGHARTLDVMAYLALARAIGFDACEVLRRL